MVEQKPRYSESSLGRVYSSIANIKRLSVMNSKQSAEKANRKHGKEVDQLGSVIFTGPSNNPSPLNCSVISLSQRSRLLSITFQ